MAWDYKGSETTSRSRSRSASARKLSTRRRVVRPQPPLVRSGQPSCSECGERNSIGVPFSCGRFSSGRLPARPRPGSCEALEVIFPAKPMCPAVPPGAGRIIFMLCSPLGVAPQRCSFGPSLIVHPEDVACPRPLALQVRLQPSFYASGFQSCFRFLGRLGNPCQIVLVRRPPPAGEPSQHGSLGCSQAGLLFCRQNPGLATPKKRLADVRIKNSQSFGQVSVSSR